MTRIILREDRDCWRHTRETLEAMAEAMEHHFGAAAAAHELGIWLGPCRGECDLSHEDEGVLVTRRMELEGRAA